MKQHLPTISDADALGSDQPDRERIEFTRLEDCGPLGEAVGPIATQHDDLAEDPNAKGLLSGGRQAVSTEIAGMLERLLANLTALQDALRHQELAESTVTARSSGLERARERHGQAEREHARGSALLPAVPSWLVYPFLALIALGEWQLNRAPLEVAGTDVLGTDILAAVAGAGMVLVVHLIGVGVRRCVDRAVRWKHQPSGWHYLVLLSGILAVLLAVWGLHELRGEYFAGVDQISGHGALAQLQLFLLWTGALLSLDHHNPTLHEFKRSAKLVARRERAFENATKELTKTAQETDKARNNHRQVVHELCERLAINTEHTVRSLEAFASGVQRATEQPHQIDAATKVADPFDSDQFPLRHALLREHLAYHGDDPVLSAQIRRWLQRLDDQQRRACEETAHEAPASETGPTEPGPAGSER